MSFRNQLPEGLIEMTSSLAMIDTRDLVFVIAGFAVLALTFSGCSGLLQLLSKPPTFIAAGIALAFSSLGFPFTAAHEVELDRKVLEHAAEVIVIISLASAGLAVDRPIGRRRWIHTWRLIGIAMPMTIAVVVWLAWGLCDLPLASAALLAACLAPTDPVLARSVQVGGPHEGEEADIRVALTAEAGLNDALAFPVVHLALALAAASAAGSSESDSLGWLFHWFSFDVVYRLAVGGAVGWCVGRALTRMFARRAQKTNGEAMDIAGLAVTAGTLLTYGLTELVDGYGFLAVFVAARAARSVAREAEESEPLKLPHHFSDQVEQVLLIALLLWLGAFAVSGVLTGWTVAELTIALLLVLVVRPSVGYLALLNSRGSRRERAAIAALGIRGFASFFYVAYAASHGEFEGLESVWRMITMTVLFSIFLHGLAAPIAIGHLDEAESA